MSSRLPWIGVAASLLLMFASKSLAQRATPTQILHPAGAATDLFGQAASIDGDTMAIGAALDDVGANGNQGSAHVYRWSGSGWTLEATLSASDGAPNDQFGASVGVSGDTIVVGAPLADVSANADRGAAYVFVRSPAGTTWTQQAKLTASDGAAGDQFGTSASISRDSVLIGANADTVGANGAQGSAYVFARAVGGTTWSQQAKLTASDGAAGDFFGQAVSISADSALIGAPEDTVGAINRQGSAYVFVRVPGATTWTQQAKLLAADGSFNDVFGTSVSLSGDTALIGAPADQVGVNSAQGSAYVFVRAPGGSAWTQQTQLIASDGAAADAFGKGVSIDADTAVIGAWGDNGAFSDQGSAYIYARAAGGTAWALQANVTAPDAAASDSFGNAVAISGDLAVVSSYGDNVGANADQGSAWVFSRVGSGWIMSDFKGLASDGAAGDDFGYWVSLSGDTALVSASHDGGSVGSAYVFVRSGATWTQQAKLTASDASSFDYFGTSVSLSGDSAIAGAYTDTIGANFQQGSVYVFVRSGTTWTQQAKLTASDGAGGDNFGISTSISGDTVLIGAPNANVGANAFQGAAYVFVRSGTTWTQQAKLTAADGAANQLLGYNVALSGNTAIVPPYIFVRSGTTWTQQAKLVTSDGYTISSLDSVSIWGDTALIGASYDDIGANIDQGSTYVFVRSGTAWAQQAKLIAPDGAAADAFGFSVSLSGDTALVGTHHAGVNESNPGSAYVFARAGTAWTLRGKFAAPDGVPGDVFGIGVAVSGSTALVGAAFDDIGATINQGSAWIFSVDEPLAHNDVLDLTFPTLASALLPAQSGQQISATEAAWRGIGSLNTFGRSLGLSSHGDVRTPPTSSIELGGSSALASAPGSAMQIFGQLRVSSGASADVTSDAFALGSRGILTARTGSSLFINATLAELEGQTRVEQGASLTFSGPVVATGSTTCNLNSSLTTGGTFTNLDTFTITTSTISAPLFWNRAQANIFGSSALFGSYSNELGATTTIRSGTLFVFGSITNNGTLVGTICSSCLGGAPNMEVSGDLSLGAAANLNLPFGDSLVHVGGALNCAINSNTRFDLSLATLQMEGTGSEQTLEVMSKDVGPNPLGLDRTISGHYPIGALHIGPSTSTVRLIDNHDNDGLGQGSCEALYVNTLRIDAGSHLINPSCKVYYGTLVNNGLVDVPSNLVPIVPPCPADLDGGAGSGNPDGGVDINDLLFFLAKFEQGHLAADLDNGTNTGTPDGGVDINDLLYFLSHFEAGC